MSYAAIATAWRTRLTALDGIGPVSTYEKFTVKNIEDPEFVQNFVDAEHQLNTWWIGRTDFDDKKTEDNDTSVKRQHAMVLQGVFAFDKDGVTQLTFQQMLEAIADDLRLGDRSFGGACLTYSLAKVSSIRITSYQGKTAMVHAAQFSTTVEEILG